MKIAFTTTFSSEDVGKWSGTPFHMATAVKTNGHDLIRIDSLKKHLPFGFKLIQQWKKLAANQRESPRFNITAAKSYSAQVKNKLTGVDAILSPQINPVAYLNCETPIILWTDALYASLVGFYPSFLNHSANSVRQGNIITQECLSRCALALFSSDWAARSAIELYGIQKNKVRVVPFGANIQNPLTETQIKNNLMNKSKNKIKLLFVGKSWYRKGGDIVFDVTQKLHQLGHAVELNFVGCMPPKNITLPEYIHCHGFISKKTVEGKNKIEKLFSESHFLFVPSRAEAYGIVFCEANAFGLPCLTSTVGGITTIVKDDVNGKTFSLHDRPEIYCDYIINLIKHYDNYELMSLNSFKTFQQNLNWKVNIERVTSLIKSL